MKICVRRQYHRGEHRAGRPDVERVIVIVVVDQQLRALEIARSHAHVVVLPHVVELSQAPVDQLQDLFMRIDNDVLRLDIAMHYALAVAVIQGLRPKGGTLSSSNR